MSRIWFGLGIKPLLDFRDGRDEVAKEMLDVIDPGSDEAVNS